ncbi:hypothetical protein E2C01_032041 [Portunus trituberculatus]|uniref:Uncharacterized protein n=1 Tax=Portunus trituberculatus TaxID=210409 RepID=A0A5B7EWE8_PORTR|nr:hypothetical protein [Portunus trituberculatus]
MLFVLFLLPAGVSVPQPVPVAPSTPGGKHGVAERRGVEEGGKTSEG